MISASFAGVVQKAEEVAVLLMVYFVTIGHAQIHAFANWSLDIESSNCHTRRCSIISVMLNHFGFVDVPNFADRMHRMGFLTYSFGETLRELLRHSMDSLPVCHRTVSQLL